jgi:hypothetical protein
VQGPLLRRKIHTADENSDLPATFPISEQRIRETIPAHVTAFPIVGHPDRYGCSVQNGLQISLCFRALPDLLRQLYLSRLRQLRAMFRSTLRAPEASEKPGNANSRE